MTPVFLASGTRCRTPLPMALTPQDTSRIAHLARLELSAAEAPEMLKQLNDFFRIV